MTMSKKELRVASHTMCTPLAGSIVAAFSEGCEVTLAAVGPLPVRTAVMAIAIANRTLASRGTILAPIISLVDRALPDKQRPGETIPWVVTTFRLISVFDSLRGPDGDQAEKR